MISGGTSIAYSRLTSNELVMIEKDGNGYLCLNSP